MGGCNLCQFLCCDISLFPHREYKSRYKLGKWHLLAGDVEEFLRGWIGSSKIVLSMFDGNGQCADRIYYWIGDTRVFRAIPFGSKSWLCAFIIGKVNVTAGS